MRVFVTGGAGFIGGRIVRILHARGDEVIAAVRDPARARRLAALGVELVAEDLSSVTHLSDRMRGVDGVIHAAGSYRIGIAPAERPQMWEANVGTTTRVLDAAVAADVPRIVYLSSGVAFGNTRGEVADETYRRAPDDPFVSYYSETKYRAHQVAEDRIARGAPVIIVLPNQVYGPGDHTILGDQLRMAYEGRVPYRTLDGIGLDWVHVDDVASGIVAALDRGRPGELYNLSGTRATVAQALDIAASLAGRRVTRRRIPTVLLRALASLVARLGPRFAALIGSPANLRETITASVGVTYYQTSEKARRELGFAPRDLRTGLRDTFEATPPG
jgi:nucleoside-diphosphate-sugar epimerase